MQLSFSISMQDTNFESTGQGDWERMLEHMQKVGFEGVQLGIKNPSHIDISQLKRVLSQTGLRLVTLGPGGAYHDDGISLVDDRKEVRIEAMERLKNLVELAGDYGAIVVIGLIRGKLKDQSNPVKARDYFERNMIELDSYAQQLSVDLVIEPLNRYETDYLNTTEEAIQLISTCGLKRTGILLDTFHMNIEEPNWDQPIKRAGEHLKHVHIADSNRWYPGCGHINFTIVIGELDRIGYQGFFTGEMLPKPDLNTAMTNYYNFMKSLTANTCAESKKE